MDAIEFRAIIEDGTIKIPREYLRSLTSRVRVILLTEESPKPTTNVIDQLLAHPAQMRDFHPLTRGEIYAR